MGESVKTTVVIPNYNGIKYIENCLLSLQAANAYAKSKNLEQYHIIVVDNGSTDGSRELVQEKFSDIELICYQTNTGFCGAVNAGIFAAKTKYVLLLNNDTAIHEDMICELEAFMEAHPKTFSASSKMVSMSEPDKIDDAGDYYCALGWAFARGKGKSTSRYEKNTKIFFACGGAAIYRRSIFDEIGVFDRAHFAYLEDLDIGYRARIYGYNNYYVPSAVCLHAGSGTSGSRYNRFKVDLSAANSIYVIGKNMPLLQIILNLPFLIIGFLVKTFFFMMKGMGGTYLKGLGKGFSRLWSKTGSEARVPLKMSHFCNYFKIQGWLWKSLIIRLFC